MFIAVGVVLNINQWRDDSIFLVGEGNEMYRYWGSENIVNKYNYEDLQYLLHTYKNNLIYIPIHYTGYFPNTRSQLIDILEELIPEVFL